MEKIYICLFYFVPLNTAHNLEMHKIISLFRYFICELIRQSITLYRMRIMNFLFMYPQSCLFIFHISVSTVNSSLVYTVAVLAQALEIVSSEKKNPMNMVAAYSIARTNSKRRPCGLHWGTVCILETIGLCHTQL